MEITEINKVYNNKFYSTADLGAVAFKVLSKEEMTEEDVILQTCLRKGLYDSMCDETGEIGIKINLDKTPILCDEK